MSGARFLGPLTSLLVSAAALVPAAASAAEPEPAWSIASVAVPTAFVPGDAAGEYFYEVTVSNGGGAVTDGSPIVVTDTLPAGLTVEKASLLVRSNKGGRPDGAFDYGAEACEVEEAGGQATVACTLTGALPEAIEPAVFHPSEAFQLVVYIDTPADLLGPLENRVEVEGGGAAPAAAESHNEASPDPAPAGFSEFRAELTGADGLADLEAASHPYQYTTTFAVHTRTAPPGSLAQFVPAEGALKDIEVALPPGLVGNPTATARCTPQQFNTLGRVHEVEHNACPEGSVVGLVVLRQVEGIGQLLPLPLYNLVPPKGMPAQLGFQLAGLPIFIDTRVRTGGDYGVTAFLPNTTESKRVTAASVTIWGVPAAEDNDRLRGTCLNTGSRFSAGTCPALQDPLPFLRLPTSCGVDLFTEMSSDTWALPGARFGIADTGAPLEGCEAVEFEPTFEARPTSSAADSPTGLRVDLHIPQNEDPAGRGEADLRDVTVTLPKGVTVNPASADGLAGCSPAQIALAEPGPPTCPNASKIGTVEVDTPLVDHPLPGAVYLGRQGENPFGSLIAIYVTVADPLTGVVVKLPGEVTPDPVSGQLTATFTDNPQVPFEDFRLEFFDGPRASLRTPPSCGTYTTTTDLRPWSTPASGPDATPSDFFAIDRGPAGGCPSGALEPRLSAGLRNPTAASYSPFDLRLTRADATAELAGLSVAAPTGLLASLRNVPYCPEAALASYPNPPVPGTGAAELASPRCPAASAVGTVSAGAGAGPAPFYAGGRVYLAGPYKGAPISLAAVIPALAGPFDLGVVAVRVALRVDPVTTQVSAVADPLPTILSGVPLDVRDIRVSLDRRDFTLAPTSCEPKAVGASVLGTNGATASLSQRFQVGGCARLPFKPTLSLKLSGGTRRSDHPALRATVTYPRHPYANIARASVALPHSEFLAQEHIRTICTRVQFAAHACPPGSVYGRARAFTPLLDKPLEGPVYLRPGGNLLPDLVAALHGQIDVELVGRIDEVNGGIRTTFDTVPDAPVTKFVLEMQGGRKGLLVNSRNICAHANRATVRMTGQNGKTHDTRPLLRDDCRGGKNKE